MRHPCPLDACASPLCTVQAVEIANIDVAEKSL
jgi:hypothetical protein